VRELGGKRGGRGEGGRNDPNIVCTYEYNKKKKKKEFPTMRLKMLSR
jgi:hypothetical protein